MRSGAWTWVNAETNSVFPYRADNIGLYPDWAGNIESHPDQAGNIGSHADQGGNLGLHPDQTQTKCDCTRIWQPIWRYENRWSFVIHTYSIES